MLSFKTIILTVLTAIFGYFLDMTTPSEEAFLYHQLETLIFTDEVQEEESFYSVIRIVDGDTLIASINGEDQRIRLLGIDTPEFVDPRKEVECFGKEATAKLIELLKDKRIRLEADLTQGDTDQFGRLLRYVFLADGLHINEEMIRLGFAHEYTYDLPYLYQDAFQQAEQEAKEQQNGLWGEACIIR